MRRVGGVLVVVAALLVVAGPNVAAAADPPPDMRCDLDVTLEWSPRFTNHKWVLRGDGTCRYEGGGTVDVSLYLTAGDENQNLGCSTDGVMTPSDRFDGYFYVGSTAQYFATMRFGQQVVDVQPGPTEVAAAPVSFSASSGFTYPYGWAGQGLIFSDPLQNCNAAEAEIVVELTGYETGGP